ncbi:MAG: competence/damage-inducible protein A [Acidobacteria bacterium]|nr:competence/damage-inducible protein A [Acidobacteriota bacterium]
MTTAAAIIIGDEILSAKVRDVNTPLLVDLLAELGVELERIVVIGDDCEAIATEVAACSAEYDAVITSGGVGPTHDDCTIKGVADAFSVGVVRHPELEAMIRAYWGNRFTESSLRIAEMPDGARLLYADDGLLPLVVFKNVYLFPGIPRLFAAKLPSLRIELSGTPKVLHNLYLNSDESRVAPILSRVAEEHGEVKIGSYPRFGEGVDHRLWISLEAIDGEKVAAATDRLLELLPEKDVVRVERESNS